MLLYIKGNLSYVALVAFTIHLIFSIIVRPVYTQTLTLCYECNSTDLNCNDNLEIMLGKHCIDETHDRCFTKIATTRNLSNVVLIIFCIYLNVTLNCANETVHENGNAVRGCLASNDTCNEPNCKSCSEDKCNDHLICKKCSGDDHNCFKIDEKTKYNTICEKDEKHCFSKLTDKKVERGCTSSSTCEGCETCSKAICNTELFPKDRRSCYNCKHQNCNQVTSKQESYCQNYVNNDSCYTYGENEESMQRGCQSYDAPSPCTAVKNDPKCQTCNTDNCNNIPFKRDQTLKCIQCGRVKEAGEDKNCFDEQDQPKTCSKQIPYYADGMCFTYVKDDNIQRGCLYDEMESLQDCDSDNGCTTCSDRNGCNGEKVSSDLTCIICRSDENPECRNKANTLTGAKCRTNDPVDDRCFFGTWHNVVIRGCYVDADEAMQYICADEKNPQCSVCHKNNCNIKTIPSSANTFYASSFVWPLFIAIYYAVTH
uniref:DUF753 domain-containing protein n=1 Tax=Glossina brevipalpis TaxID=37001 RepID=A0A1A9WKR1_9MUSC